MQNNFISFLIKLFVAIKSLFGIIMCLCWYPFSISLTTVGIVDVIPTTMQNIELYVQLFFYWSVSIPCFIFLNYVWKLSNIIKKDEVFKDSTIKIMNRGIRILFVDLIFFVIGNLVFMFLGWNDFAIFYFILAAIGFAVICLLEVISRIISKAICLKENVPFNTD
ncbi:MAG: DUF2975 domain-containing protein [Clostridia bacterium]|nr:DUF2975 domain-containing protein [Clostridia bacterium]